MICEVNLPVEALKAGSLAEAHKLVVDKAILDETCCLQKIFVCRCEYFRNRTPDSGGGEVGETAPPAFAANDGPETTRRTVGVCRFLERN